MISGDVKYLCAFAHHFQDGLQHFYMTLWKVVFTQIPNVNKVTINNEYFGVNAFKVSVEFFGVAAVGAEVSIRYYSYFNVALRHVQKVLQKNVANAKTTCPQGYFVVNVLLRLRYAPTDILIQPKVLVCDT